MHVQTLTTLLVLAAAPAVLGDHGHGGKHQGFVKVKRGGGTLHLIGDETVAKWSGGGVAGPPAIIKAVVPTTSYTNVIDSINAGLGVPPSLLTKATASLPTTLPAVVTGGPATEILPGNLKGFRAGYGVNPPSVSSSTASPKAVKAAAESSSSASPTTSTRVRPQKGLPKTTSLAPAGSPAAKVARRGLEESEEEAAVLEARANVPDASSSSSSSSSSSEAASSSKPVASSTPASSSAKSASSASKSTSSSASKSSSSSASKSTSSSASKSASSSASSSASVSSSSIDVAATGSAKIIAAAGVSPADQGTAQGWGAVFANKYTTMSVNNRGMRGISARSYYRDAWSKTISAVNSGDVVVLEFGHYDNKIPGSVADTNAGCVGSVPGYGSQTTTITGCDGNPETVLTYNAYLEKMCADVSQKGATCVISSMTPKNEWRRGDSPTFVSGYPGYARQAASASGAIYVPHQETSMKTLASIGQTLAPQYFMSGDNLQTNAGGAEAFAASFAAALYCAGAGRLTSGLTSVAQALSGQFC